MEGEVEQDIDKLLEELRFTVKSEKESEDINQVLDSILNVSKPSFGESTEFGMDDVFLMLLHHESKDIIAKTAKAIAEIAKSERGRKNCSSADLVTALIDLLKEDQVDVLTQTSRALGNIFYGNGTGKKYTRDKDGLKSILVVLEKSITLKNEEGASLLRNVAAGLLLNFLVDQPYLYKEVLQQGTVPIICSMLEMDGITNSEAAKHALLILDILNCAEIIFLDERLTKVLMDILASEISLELSKMCLELLHGQAEDENVKFLLAKGGVCERLLNLLENQDPHCTDEDSRSVLKFICKLIVLILTGDDSMNFLYNNSNGAVYQKLVQWLQIEDVDLQIAAVLAMGNFARSDDHCKLMVQQGVHRSLLSLLRENIAETADIRFQHALLSALRNLVIPVENKAIILKDKLLDVLCKMIDIPQTPVVYKLLGTLRIAIDGQREAAIDLGRREDLIKKVVGWCDTEDHPGIQGEAKRFFTWLIHNNRDKQVALLMMKHGATKPLTELMLSRYDRMQNEALIGLTILSKMCLQECEKPLVQADVGQKLCKFFENADNLAIPILCNAFTFLNSITDSEILREHLRKTDLVALCTKAIIDKNNQNLEKSSKTFREKMISGVE